jgi:hypothetical protein
VVRGKQQHVLPVVAAGHVDQQCPEQRPTPQVEGTAVLRGQHLIQLSCRRAGQLDHRHRQVELPVHDLRCLTVHLIEGGPQGFVPGHQFPQCRGQRRHLQRTL